MIGGEGKLIPLPKVKHHNRGIFRRFPQLANQEVCDERSCAQVCEAMPQSLGGLFTELFPGDLIALAEIAKRQTLKGDLHRRRFQA
jgi:hypothetical protein